MDVSLKSDRPFVQSKIAKGRRPEEAPGSRCATLDFMIWGCHGKLKMYIIFLARSVWRNSPNSFASL
jgi:hypothetical protein